MIRIRKGQEPRAWRDYRLTPGVTYAANEPLRYALLLEQGYICAYCMRRIPVPKLDPGNPESTRIDHVRSRRDDPDSKLIYNNMVICCPGCINGEAHCDKSKGYSEIHFSLFRQNIEESISYSSKDGGIKSSNKAWDEDINEILKLNNAMLKLYRLNVIDGVRSYLEAQKWRPAKLREQLEGWESKDGDGKYKEYCGVVREYLRKKIRAMNV